MHQPISIREDCRRDGLAASFLLNGEAISYLGRSFPNSKINIGYPTICDAEYNACKEILNHNKYNSGTELALVGHAKTTHLIAMNNLLKPYSNVSANIWMPISDYFNVRTLNIHPDKVIDDTVSLVNYWNVISGNKPFDVAFADMTSPENELEKRVNSWGKKLLDAGVRNIILCDTRGISSPEYLNELLNKIDIPVERLEFHPHNDNGNNKKNVKIAIDNGIKQINTAVYSSSERRNMLDPRELLSHGLKFNKTEFQAFESIYKDLIGDKNKVLESVFGDNIITTGTQYRLRDRDPKLELRFGVTSDKFILSNMTGIKLEQISTNFLQHLKNKLLYEKERVFLSADELRKELNINNE